MKTIVLIMLCVLPLCACKKQDISKESGGIGQNSQDPKTGDRIISLSGGITEVVSALGHENSIVGVDITSTYPQTLKGKAKELGHVRSMTIEPIMALNPSLILASDKDISSELWDKIKLSGIKLEILKQEYSVEGTLKLIEQVASILGEKDYKNLNKKIDDDLQKVQHLIPKPKVLFIYARGNNLLVSGKNTPMDKLIELAGGQNAIQEFSDFKALTPESMLKANPDVLFFFTSGLLSAGGEEAVLKMPGVSQTKAGKNKRIISMDGGLVSSFGPRIGEAVLELNKKLIESAE
ncbi:ABC transporter substrate-binding protein [Elizabethkingia argentiflava]|uniref:ABC transporter substrate-binding protein n=1 Tax=Elizabethkingia argenteiflava TaxID=2681556 RepID=A0A845PTZ3_9FLAO|nr:ABC transporter substrate-binding protein [Elizabethkingia argenteiflava]NAW51702.1 ABC transporter substrate-binding protein [Elizabethkingia argenteiflava]